MGKATTAADQRNNATVPTSNSSSQQQAMRHGVWSSFVAGTLRVPSAFPLFRSRGGPVPRGRATAHGVCLLHQVLANDYSWSIAAQDEIIVSDTFQRIRRASWSSFNDRWD